MRTLVSNYLRQSAALATAWQQRYKTDVLFRSTVSVVMLLFGLGVISIGLFWLILTSANEAIVAAIINNIEEIIHGGESAGNLPSSIHGIQNTSLLYAFIGMAVTGSVFGYLLFRFMLLPAQNTLHYQKLFISNVAHELRTPLSIIKTSTEVALLDEKLPRSAQKTFSEIVHELDRLSEIVNNLLSLNNLTRPERIRFGNVDLLPLVETVVNRHATLAHERKIAVTIKNGGYATVWGNAIALEQVITNLVKNALVYTQKNGNGNVVISVYPDYQGSVIITVTDNGIGIAQRDLVHIFEPFYRADVSRVRNVRSSGSGLGLAIVNELVRAHHGRINVESARNEGTTVTVTLPVGVTREMSPEIGTPQNGKNHLAVDFSKKIHL